MRQRGNVLIYLIMMVLVAAVIIGGLYLWKKGQTGSQTISQPQVQALPSPSATSSSTANVQDAQSIDLGNTDSDLSNIDQQLKGL